MTHVVRTEEAKMGDPGRWAELFEERAAIREFEGGMCRGEAERLAVEDVRREWEAAMPKSATPTG